MRFVPAMGLLLASPVLWQAAQGTRPVSDALLVWLLAMVLACLGCWLWRAATAPSEVVQLQTVPLPPPHPRRRADDL